MSPRGKQTFAEAGIEVNRPGGSFLKLVGTINFKAIIVMKKGQAVTTEILQQLFDKKGN